MKLLKTLRKSIAYILYASIFTFLTITPASSLESSEYKSNVIEAKLISAQNGVSSNQKTFSAALKITLEDGWKTYWRSPGEVGLPPEITWENSKNIKSVEFQWPKPKRFKAFGIENFGYSKSVTFPLNITLINLGEPIVLNAQVNMLLCSNVCIPEKFLLTLNIPKGNGIDKLSASYIAKAIASVPSEPRSSHITLQGAYISKNSSNLIAKFKTNTSFIDPDVFPEYNNTRFAAPEFILENQDKTLWVKFPIIQTEKDKAVLQLTLVDTDYAVTFATNELKELDHPFQDTSSGKKSLIWMILIAFIGGLILNIMPCVLPVLSIKISSVIMAHTKTPSHIRTSFLASTFGVLAFMWALAIALLIAKYLGHSIGWGIQFQNPFFLAFVISVLILFCTNMLGLFNINLSQNFTSKISDTQNKSGYLGDFLTGSFTALMATPCSAPFLGTAVAFALSGTMLDTIGIFTGLGIGLAFPYILFAAFPNWVRYLPKPGNWMNIVKIILAVFLASTAIWLSLILTTITSTLIAMFVIGLSLAAIALLTIEKIRPSLRIFLASILILLAILSPLLPASNPKGDIIKVTKTTAIPWQEFKPNEISLLIAKGQTVFIDITADWCLTCKANKTLVLNRTRITEALRQENIIPMLADWTQADPKITDFLQSHNRFGIPFNIVYGPNAPKGIILPEILSQSIILNAIEQAKAR